MVYLLSCQLNRLAFRNFQLSQLLGHITCISIAVSEIISRIACRLYDFVLSPLRGYRSSLLSYGFNRKYSM